MISSIDPKILLSDLDFTYGNLPYQYRVIIKHSMGKFYLLKNLGLGILTGLEVSMIVSIYQAWYDYSPIEDMILPGIIVFFSLIIQLYLVVIYRYLFIKKVISFAQLADEQYQDSIKLRELELKLDHERSLKELEYYQFPKTIDVDSTDALIRLPDTTEEIDNLNLLPDDTGLEDVEVNTDADDGERLSNLFTLIGESLTGLQELEGAQKWHSLRDIRQKKYALRSEYEKGEVESALKFLVTQEKIQRDTDNDRYVYRLIPRP